VFAAGADIGELASASAIDMYVARRVDAWDAIRGIRTPLVAAVSGFCLGGGCELAMACDLIVASETALFGQPETGLGLIPGAGGTQRLIRAVGKALAMDVILSGRRLTAREALAAGLVARVVAKEAWLDEAKAWPVTSPPGPVANQLARRRSTRGRGPLAGVDHERRLFYLAVSRRTRRKGIRVREAPPSFKAGRLPGR
jgi:enoyl-CoA hydratase